MKLYKSNITLILFLAFISLGCSKPDDEVSPNPTNPIATNPPSPVVVVTSPRTVINTLSVPWEIIWGPDNFIWTTERNGRISRINPETGQQTVIHTVANVVQTQGAGLLGMILHPNFPTQPYLYIVYVNSRSDGARTRVVRFTYANNGLSNETVLLDNIPAGATHNGAKLLIDNNFLYVTTGDIDDASLSQNLNSLIGKTLRMTLTGGIPSDNPFPNSYVWSYGHRNSQGLLLHPNGNLYNSEHGPTGDDEFNLITRGGNYGWPNIAGVTDNANERTFASTNSVIDAISVWSPAIAPADLIFYNNARIPRLQNKVLMTALRGQTLIALTLSADGRTVTNREEFLSNQFGRLRDICVAPDGRIFIATGGSSYASDANHSIVEITGL